MRINTNILSLSVLRSLSQTNRALARAMQRLATGSRVNSARDDAAGMARGTGLESQRRGMLQAVRNMNDSRGFLSTADGAMAAQNDLIQRMRELSMQAANGTLSDQDRSYLDNELQQILQEFDRIATQTEFNGVKLLDGSFTTTSLQVGTNKGQTINFSISSTRSSAAFTLPPTAAIGTGTFQLRSTLATDLGPKRAAIGDINNDGINDIVSGEFTAGHGFSIYLGTGSGSFAARSTYFITNNIASVSLKDLNGDGKLDLIGVQASGGFDYVITAIGNGNGTFQAARTFAKGASAISSDAEVVDVNGDGKLDVLASDEDVDTVSVFIGNGDGTFQTSSTFLTGDRPVGTASGDFNGDGKIDLLTTDIVTFNLNLHLGNGDGTFQAKVVLGAAISPTDPTVGDFNRDGKLDIAVACTTSQLAVYLGNGNGTFQARTTYVIGASAGDTDAADFNGDGILDLVTTHSTNLVSILIGTGNGTFAAATTYTTGGTTAFSSVIGDLNGDGVADILVSNFGSASVTFLQGNTTGSNTYQSISIASQDQAADMLDVFSDALDYINSARSNLGALQSRLDYAENNALNLIENISAAKSQIMDTDFAAETAELTRQQILQSAGISVLSQANLSAQLSLRLLQALG